MSRVGEKISSNDVLAKRIRRDLESIRSERVMHIVVHVNEAVVGLWSFGKLNACENRLSLYAFGSLF